MSLRGRPRRWCLRLPGRHWALALLMLLGLAACGAEPGASPPTVVPNTSTPLTQPSRAFWRDSQVWVSLNSGAPTQVTHITYPASAPGAIRPVPGALRWSPGGRYLAFSYTVAPKAGGTWGLARLGMIDTMTGSITYPAVPGLSLPVAGLEAPLAVNVWTRGGYGWSDVTTLIVAGLPPQAQRGAGPIEGLTTIYTVDATSGAASTVAGLQRLHIGAIEVRAHTIFYSTYLGESDTTGAHAATLHRFDIVGNTDTTLVALGVVSILSATDSDPLVGAFDVSAAGTTMVYQRIDAFDATGSSPSMGAAYVLAGTDGTRAQAVLAGLATDHHGARVELALAPDGSRVAAATSSLVAMDNAAGTNYLVLTPADTSPTLTYRHIVWTPDGSSFTMDREDAARDDRRIYTIQPLYAPYLANASLLSWWPASTGPL